MLHLVQKHFLQFCHLSKYLCRGVSTPRCLLVKRNGETFKADQAAQITQTHLISREKFDPRVEGGLGLDTETSRSVDPGLLLKPKRCHNIVIIEEEEGELRPSGTRRCYKSSRGPSGGRGTLQYYCCHFKCAWLLFLMCSLSTVTRPLG